MEKAPLDETGRDFVRRAMAEPRQLARLEAGDLLKVAIIAQQHGLIDEGRSVFDCLNSRFPEFSEGWQQHLELLHLLGDRRAMVKLLARAGAHLPDEQVNKWRGAASGIPETGTPTGPDIAAPFQQLRREERHIQLFMRIFQGREDAFARQWVNRAEGKQGYVPVHRPLQPSDIKDHLNGRRTYGIYLLDHGSRVHTGVIDMDLVSRLRSADQAAKHRSKIRRETLYLHKRIATLSHKAGLCCLAEVSGGKGYHFWFPVSEPVPAADMRKTLLQLTDRLAEDVECFTLEVFPKQDRRTGKGFGNLVKLPLGIHRGTGKPSTFVLAADRTISSQFELLARLEPSSPETLLKLAAMQKENRVLVHPRHAAWADEYPELARLEVNCPQLGQIMATLRSARELTMREEKILLGTLGHLPRARLLLHHLFEKLPEYNRPLLDYKISKIRGTVLGCKRIHSLLEAGGDLPCEFRNGKYPHPLLHLDGFADDPEPRSEKVENLQDAMNCLKTAIQQVERFM
jgi:hypothetical protein